MILGLSNKKFDSSHDGHRAVTEKERYWKPSRRGEYHYFSWVMAISYSIFFSTEAGVAYINPEVTELLKFWMIETDASEREKPRLGLLVENEPQTICVPRSEKGVELRLGGEKKGLFTNLVVVWIPRTKRRDELPKKMKDIDLNWPPEAKNTHVIDNHA